MAKAESLTRKRTLSTASPDTLPNGHDLIAIAEWLPGRPATDTRIELGDGHEYETRFWRCRTCGQERNRREAFTEPCQVAKRLSPVIEGGYSIEDPRTRRALSDDMTVHFVEGGPRYRVDSESGRTYRADVEAETCSCPDHEKREVFCKHLRRVDLDIRAGVTQGPDGTFNR